MLSASLFLILSPLFSTVISSNICTGIITPSFTTQNTTTTASTDVIAGLTTAGASVSIDDNSQNVASLTADSSGDFSLEVSLNLGTNDFTATATNSCGSASTTSPLVITRNQVPSSPTTGSSTTTSTPRSSSTSSIASITSSTASPLTPSASNSVTLSVNVPSAAFTASGVTTTKDHVFLRGKSVPGAQITIYDNGLKVAELTAASDGSFGVSIPLKLGINHIVIYATFNGHTQTESLTYIRTAVVVKSHSYTWLWWLIGVLVVVYIGIQLLVLRIRHSRKKEAENEIKE